MRFLPVILGALALVFCSPAMAQKTKGALQIEINNNCPDNTSGQCTPALLRQTQSDIVNSMVGIINNDFTQSQGTGLARTYNAKLQDRPLDLADYCIADYTGNSDMTTCLNTAITAAKDCNSATQVNNVLTLKSGTLLAGNSTAASALIPKSCMSIKGQGPGQTILKLNGTSLFAQTGGTQVIFASISDLTIDCTGFTTATPFSFTAIQASKIKNISFHNCSAGILMQIAGQTITSFDINVAAYGSNTVYNEFANWVSDSTGQALVIQGNEGSACSGSPTVVVTNNRYHDMRFYGATVSKVINLQRAVDSEFFDNLSVFTTTNGQVAVQIGDDNATCSGNNNVNGIQWSGIVSMISPATSQTWVQIGNFTFGNNFKIISDTAATAATWVNVQSTHAVTFNGIEVCSTNAFPLASGGPSDTDQQFICASFGKYTYADSGSPAHPTTAFTSDLSTGTFLRSAGIMGFSKGISCGDSTTAGCTIDVYGSGSGHVSIKPQAAAGTYNFNIPITAGTNTTAPQLLGSGGGGANPMTWVAHEESTWPCQLKGSTGGGTPTQSVAVCTYEQIGRQITARFSITTTNLNAPTGLMQITALPLTSANTANDNGTCYISGMTGVTMDASYVNLTGTVTPNTTTISLTQNGSAQALTPINISKFAAATTLIGACSYHN